MNSVNGRSHIYRTTRFPDHKKRFAWTAHHRKIITPECGKIIKQHIDKGYKLMDLSDIQKNYPEISAAANDVLVHAGNLFDVVKPNNRAC